MPGVARRADFKLREEYRERQEEAAPTPEEREAKRTVTSFYEALGRDGEGDGGVSGEGGGGKAAPVDAESVGPSRRRAASR